jgi:hypothetical protein
MVAFQLTSLMDARDRYVDPMTLYKLGGDMKEGAGYDGLALAVHCS